MMAMAAFGESHSSPTKRERAQYIGTSVCVYAFVFMCACRGVELLILKEVKTFAL